MCDHLHQSPAWMSSISETSKTCARLAHTYSKYAARHEFPRNISRMTRIDTIACMFPS